MDGFQTMYSWVMLALITLPFSVIGFVCGMLMMRTSYMDLLRRMQNENRKLQRRLDHPGVR